MCVNIHIYLIYNWYLIYNIYIYDTIHIRPSSFSHSPSARPRDHRRLPGLGRASLGGPGAGRAGLAAADPAAGRAGDGRGVAARVLLGRKNQGKTRGKMMETREVGKIGKTIGK